MSENQKPQAEALATQYSNGQLNRREFLTKLIALTGSMAAAHVLLEQQGFAQVVSEKEAAAANLEVKDVTYTGSDAPTGGYLAAPKKEGTFPGILVIHENRGLNEHTRDVARRFAAEGFVALATDALARVGGTAKFATPDDARTAIGQVTPEQALADLEAGLAYLDTLPNVKKGHLASIGFCWGGARSFALATESPRLKAAVVFYGSAPAPEKLKELKVPVLGIYGSLDTRITSAVPEVAKLLTEAGKSFQYNVYEGANHAFFNDAGPRYDAKASADAWAKTLAFLRDKLA